MKMTRDEKIAAGIVLSETKHNGHRRAFFHDYSRPGLYMITLVTEGRLRLFGRIVGHSSEKKGTENYPHLEYSRLGSVIIHEELAKISQFYPMVEVCKVALMPDHIHLLIKVREQLPHGKHLGNVVRGFKTGCTRAWWKLQDEMGISGGMVGNTVPEALVGRTVPEACQRHLPLVCVLFFLKRVIMTVFLWGMVCLRISVAIWTKTHLEQS